MHRPLDRNGNLILVGKAVRLLNAPEELLSDIPQQDQDAIKQVVGKEFCVESFDQYGHAELSFQDTKGNVHFIWVRPSALESLP